MSKELRYLSFQGGNTKKNRLYDKQRQQLDTRANFIRNVQANPQTYIDPVLRYHLGLDPPKPKDKK
jgi:hypothetical protein